VYAAVRRYSGLDRSLIDALAQQAGAVRAALSSTPGSQGCDLISTREGLIVVAFGDDEGSVVEMGRRYVAWLDGHLPGLRDVLPDVWAGEVLVHGLEPAVA
jgi:hypothetical protein